MKNFVLVLFILFFAGPASYAQYRINRKIYDSKTYTHRPGDPYNPVVAGVSSFLIPGLGQIISHEPGRGVAFMGGALVCASLFIGGAFSGGNDSADEGSEGGGFNLAAAGAIGLLAVDIWSVVDAVHVAKVNDLAWRDKGKSGYYPQLSPCFGSFHTGGALVGLSFLVRF